MSTDPSFSRRDFLLRSGRVAGLAALATASGFALHERARSPFDEADETAVVRDLRIRDLQAKLVVASGDDPAQLVRASIAALGGMSRFISKGDRVVVKPNIGWDRLPEQAANTNPFVVKAIVEECFSAGAASVLVTDVSCNDAERCFARSGIQKAAEEAGATVERPTQSRFKQIAMGGEVLGKRPVYDAYLTADKCINVPIAKHHGLSGTTLALKNLYGILSGNRNQLHQDIHASIADLGNFLRATLTIMDGYRVLRRNGPQGGNLADVETPHTLIASVDPVAVDAYTADRFFQLGADRLPYLAKAEKYGLGKVNFRELPFEEIRI